MNSTDASPPTRPRWRPTLALLLSCNGGFVDTAGFLALQGLFTAHVTGNFVTFGAAAVLGTSGAVAKLLALPMFSVVVLGTRFLSQSLPARGLPVTRTILTLMLVLLIGGSGLAVGLGPFADGDSWQAIVTGMTLVAAMAIQNAFHRIHLSSSPPSTLMTGTTTQIMIDVADLLRGGESKEIAVARSRLLRFSASVTAFALGCAAAALTFSFYGVWCFTIPPLLGVWVLLESIDAPDPTAPS
ncbi:YoaK family protein [Variovorax sp. GT1P44]|uniref:YoaK family protein n=1 Tax=Variovorax sp. GT1P44 TaxID=3443742 RepID=UPI003F489B5E